MDRNREARRAAAMTNGLPRRRHRTTTGGSLRESPEDEGPMELQETAARLRDRTVKKDRDREVRDRERDRERERDRDRGRDRDRERDRDRLNRSKRRRSDKYIHREDGGGGGGAGDDSSEGSVNDEEEEEDEGQVRYVPPPNPAVVPSASPASTLMSHRKSYPPPSKVIRVAPTWKAPDEMIGVSIPRKARSASTKRGHDCWSSAGVGSNGEQPVNMNRQASPSPVRSTTPGQTPVTAAAAPPPPLPSQGRPMSPSSSNISVKKKIKAANGPKQQRPPKSSKSSPPVQDDIEIEVAEVLYGLKRQSHAPSKQDAGTSNDSTIKLDSRSIHDSKSKVSSPLPNSSSLHNHNNINNPSTSSSIPPTTIAAPKRKKSRPYHEEIPGNLSHRSSPKAAELDQPPKMEAPPQSTDMKAEIENGGEMVNNKEAQAEAAAATVVARNDMLSDAKKGLAEESAGIRNGMLRAKVEEASTSPKLESPQNHDRVESSTTSTKTNFVEQENPREDKLEIDLMAPPPQARASPERVEEMAEYGGRDEKCMVTERETDAKARLEEDEKVGQSRGSGGVESKKAEADTSNFVPPPSTSSQAELNLNGKERERKIDLHLDLEKTSMNDDKLNVQKPQPPPKVTRDDATTDTKPGGQSGSGPLPLSVPGGWHGGLPPMGYVGPLQGVVSMDGTPMASPPIQHPTPHFLFTQPKPKRCATHCYVARSISVHQQMMKMNPFWPAAAAAAAVGTAPLFGGKPYNLNMMPSADLHAAAAAGRGVVVNSSQDNKGQPFTLFPGQPASSSKNKSPQTTSAAPDNSAQKKQFLLQPAMPPGAPSNLMPGPALFFPMGQQQPAAANARPASSPSTTGAASGSASTTASTSAPMNAVAPNSGPAMSFSYPNMGGNEAQFMAILGNGAYPFPIPAHVGAAPPYRGSHPPQAMSFYNGSFYSSQMLHHPSQLQQQQSQSMQIQQQIQQQSQPNASISTASSSSQKQLQNLQQQRPHGNSGNMNQGVQNFQANKGARASQPHHELGGEDSPSTADSRTRPNLSVYGQNFAMPPFHSANFALMTPPSSMGSNAAGVPNGNLGDKKQQQPQQTPAFPMSFATLNGATTPGLDISSIAHNHAMMQNLPEAARQNYQMMAAAAAAQVQVAQQKKNNHRGSEDGKTGAAAQSDPPNIDEERKALAARAAAAAATAGQSIAFSRDLSENSMPGNNVVDTSARSLNLIHGSSTRPTRSSAPNTMGNSNASSNSQQQQHNQQHQKQQQQQQQHQQQQQQQHQQQQQQHQQQHQQQQQQQQMLFAKQQQYASPPAGSGRSKTPTTSNGNVYPDHLTSSSVMAAKFPNSLAGFPPLVQQTSGSPAQYSQWKNSVRPNTSQVSSQTIAGSNASNIKNLPQQQGRTQQNQTQISFGATASNPKASSASQGQQAQNNNQAPPSPMVVGSPSTPSVSVSKGAGGSPRTNAGASTGNKVGGQASTLSSQQEKNSQSPSLNSQKPSVVGSPHHIMSNTNSGNKPQMHQPQQQPQMSKQTIQQTQLFFNNYMQAAANTSAAMVGSGYYIQRHRPDNQQQQQQQQHGSKSQGMGHTSSSSGMLSLCTPVSLANSSTSDPAKAVAAAAAAANHMKGNMPSQGMFHPSQFGAQSVGGGGGGAHQLMPAGFPYVHAVSTAVQVKPAEQKQPAGE